MPLSREDAIDDCRRRFSIYNRQISQFQLDAAISLNGGKIKDAAGLMSRICESAGAAAGCLHELNMLIRLRGQRERTEDAEVQ